MDNIWSVYGQYSDSTSDMCLEGCLGPNADFY